MGVLSRSLENPSDEHISGGKRLLRYLKGTIEYGLLYSREINCSLYLFSDSDYANDTCTRKSTSGMIAMLGKCTVSWRSQQQKCISISTTEAEYVAASEAVKDIIWLKRLWNEFTNVKCTCTLYLDNQSAIKMIKNPEYHKRTKHIDIRFHFIREHYSTGEFDLQYIGSSDQLADILTKPLPKPQFCYLRNFLVTNFNK